MYDHCGGPSQDPDETEPGIIKERPLSARESRNNRTSTPEGDEIQERYPLLLLFPELRNNSVDMHAILDGNTLPEDITRMLVGKKADFTHLKKSRQRQDYSYDYEDHLPTILEEQVFLISEHRRRGNLKL